MIMGHLGMVKDLLRMIKDHPRMTVDSFIVPVLVPVIVPITAPVLVTAYCHKVKMVMDC